MTRRPAPRSAVRKAAALLHTRPDLAERILLLAEPELPARVACVADAATVVVPLLAGHEAERLVAVAIDRRGRVIEAAVLTVGSDTYCIVEPRQVLRWALTRRRGAAGLIIAHNHPAGDPTPSGDDEVVTRRMADACTVVGIPLLDHIVVSSESQWVSCAVRGMLPAGAVRAGWTE